jgi:hypothetical protein
VEGDDPFEAGFGLAGVAADLSEDPADVDDSLPPESLEVDPVPDPDSLPAPESPDTADEDDSLGTEAEPPPDRLSVL